MGMNMHAWTRVFVDVCTAHLSSMHTNNTCVHAHTHTHMHFGLGLGKFGEFHDNGWIIINIHKLMKTDYAHKGNNNRLCDNIMCTKVTITDCVITDYVHKGNDN